MLCNLCPRLCNVDRSVSRGICLARNAIKVAAIVIHRGEEPPFVKGKGSGAIFFTGCPVRCKYCQNKEISHTELGTTLTPQELARYMIKLQRLGSSNVNLITPTHYTPWILTSIKHAMGMGLTIPLMVNSGGYELISTINMWYGYASIYLIDLKYGDNATGQMLSGVRDYWDISRKIIRHIWDNIGPLKTALSRHFLD